MSNHSERWTRLSLTRLQDLSAQRRHAVAEVAGNLSDMLEEMGGRSPAAAAVVSVLQQALAVIFEDQALETYMGKAKNDAYGIIRDAEAGSDQIVRYIAFGREQPRRRIRIPISQERAVEIEHRVDLLRSGGGIARPEGLEQLLGPQTYEEVLLATEGDDQDELLIILCDALEGASVDRMEVLRLFLERRDRGSA